MQVPKGVLIKDQGKRKETKEKKRKEGKKEGGRKKVNELKGGWEEGREGRRKETCQD